MKKVLNLYAGIGGNRKLWEDVEVTAVELNPEIAKIYQDFFPDDTVIVADAHQYLLEHYDEGWDFIWSSPPCPSHSKIRKCGVHRGLNAPVYPDMKLYEEVIFLNNFVLCIWVVENVIAYYDPLIKPVEMNNHFIWSNIKITEALFRGCNENIRCNVGNLQKYYDFDLSKYKIKNKMKILRNCIEPKLGLHIFNCAFKIKQEVLF